MRTEDTLLGMKALAQRVQRARADVAIPRPQRAKREGEKVASRISGGGGLHSARRVHEERRLKVAQREGRRQKAEVHLRIRFVLTSAGAFEAQPPPSAPPPPPPKAANTNHKPQ